MVPIFEPQPSLLVLTAPTVRTRGSPGSRVEKMIVAPGGAARRGDPHTDDLGSFGLPLKPQKDDIRLKVHKDMSGLWYKMGAWVGTQVF